MLDLPSTVDIILSVIAGFISLYLILTASAVLYITYHARHLRTDTPSEINHRISILIYTQNHYIANTLYDINTGTTTLNGIYLDESETSLKLVGALTVLLTLVNGPSALLTLGNTSIYANLVLIIGFGALFAAARIVYYRYKHYRLPDTLNVIEQNLDTLFA